MAIYSGPIKKAIQSNKYQKDISIGNDLSKMVAEYIKDLDIEFDMIIPVPLGKVRLAMRGYNQVGTFTFPLSLVFDVNYSPKALTRIRDTKPQVGLSAAERRNNVNNAFYADHKLVHGKNILVIDDVATTGATLSSAADALLNAQANKVVAVSIARAVTHN
ncbi:ComF family protein [Chloroflexota bacterium]